MRKFVYYAPTKIVFGKDTEMQAGELVRSFGGSRVFVVYGTGSAKKSGLLDRVMESLAAENLPAMASGGVVPNPHLTTVRRMVKEAVDFRADFILAVGGGSVIDTAKAVAHGTANPETDVWDFWTKKAPLTRSLPHGSILTISAAGSETSDSCVITKDDEEPWTKRGINTDLNRCKFTIMNPELTQTLPVYQIASGVADIFMHTDERYFTTLQGNHLTDRIAEALFRDIIEYGRIGVADPTNYEAMSEIMWCGSVSHVGMTGVGAKGDTAREGDWGVHQLGMALSALYDVTHGPSLTAVWGSWARYVVATDPARFAQLGRRVFDIEIADDAAAAQAAIEAVEDFFRSIGMPTSLTELMGRALTDDELKDVTRECTYDYTRHIGTFQDLDADDILKIYEAAR
ncbi:MAG: iron-containing alcohol dehydrogenase [Eubacterium sp.]|nr:iron-containing alcohol dehydrogenase [Eubacterium sp.]